MRSQFVFFVELLLIGLVRADLPQGCQIVNSTTILCVNPNSTALDNHNVVQLDFLNGPGHTWDPLDRPNLRSQTTFGDQKFYADCGPKCGLDFVHNGKTYYQNQDGLGLACGAGANFKVGFNFLGHFFGLTIHDWQISAAIALETDVQSKFMGVHAFLFAAFGNNNAHKLADKNLLGHSSSQPLELFPWVTVMPIGIHVWGIGSLDAVELQVDVGLPSYSFGWLGFTTGNKIDIMLQLKGACLRLGFLGEHCVATLGPWPVLGTTIPSFGIQAASVKCGHGHDATNFFECEFDMSLIHDPVGSFKIALGVDDSNITVYASLSWSGKVLAHYEAAVPAPEITNLYHCFSCDGCSESQVCLTHAREIGPTQLGIEIKNELSGEVLASLTHPSFVYSIPPIPTPHPTPPARWPCDIGPPAPPGVSQSLLIKNSKGQCLTANFSGTHEQWSHHLNGAYWGDCHHVVDGTTVFNWNGEDNTITYSAPYYGLPEGKHFCLAVNNTRIKANASYINGIVLDNENCTRWSHCGGFTMDTAGAMQVNQTFCLSGINFKNVTDFAFKNVTPLMITVQDCLGAGVAPDPANDITLTLSPFSGGQSTYLRKASMPEPNFLTNEQLASFI